MVVSGMSFISALKIVHTILDFGFEGVWPMKEKAL